MELHDSLMKILTEFEQKVYGKWKKEIESKVSKSLKRTLLFRNDDKLLTNNFEDEWMLAEIKLLKLMGMEDIPDAALQFVSREDEFWVNLIILRQ